MAHFAFSMQNCIHYFRWTAVLAVVTNSFSSGPIREKYGRINKHVRHSLHILCNWFKIRLNFRKKVKLYLNVSVKSRRKIVKVSGDIIKSS